MDTHSQNLLIEVWLWYAVLRGKFFQGDLMNWYQKEKDTQGMERVRRSEKGCGPSWKGSYMRLQGNKDSASWPSACSHDQYLLCPTTLSLFLHVCTMGSVLEVSVGGNWGEKSLALPTKGEDDHETLSCSACFSVSIVTWCLLLAWGTKQVQTFLSLSLSLSLYIYIFSLFTYIYIVYVSDQTIFP
jgi:hypothetical protein